MKFNFYVVEIYKEQGNGDKHVWGFAFNLKREIPWNYNLDTGELEILNAIIGPSFEKDLEDFLSENLTLENVVEIVGMGFELRKKEVKKRLLENRLNRHFHKV